MKEAASPSVCNRVKEKLSRNELVLSMTVRLVRTIEIAVLAKSAGFDSLYIDLEHSSFSLETTSQICMASFNLGVAPFVRLASTAPEYIGRVLDGGAVGIIAPHIQSAADAEAVVRAAKYPPLGTRSFTGSLPQLEFRSYPSTEIFSALNQSTVVMAMIESADALDAVEEIAAVDGVDVLFIGTNDLCASLGIPGQLDHPRVREAYVRTIDACRKRGKHVGIGGLVSNPKLAAEFVELGARYVSTGTDLSFLSSAANAKASQMRDLCAG
ncbi:2-dehydro-3,6-dideoxy-6-sulfogluconate aldolase [Cupriavidus yeoncheonensis]|uniref:2-dehydro-3,6-dideoxy-6-sulfogluconate aldolase n=1 Tax=Cupriavidus yeoncheonensis TaxID=1462994 RepID=A0A916IY60_9BURK|nr:aldolase/citrate lyase family protein [Cupriavidus yeoncheonensis]CAG2153866.1 2-dehydro-3,6-dideoxy-6-sulfogluconate aldolase [Cupriavidus yeoncheonensis]